MSKDKTEADTPKKGGFIKLLLIVVAVLVLLAAGAGAALYASQSGLLGANDGQKVDPNKPRLVLRDGGTEPARTGKLDPSRYQASYFEIEKVFTSNLRDSDAFLQVAIGVSTFYDERVIENVKHNEVPIRSAVLMAMADHDAAYISTPEGKNALQVTLKNAINRVLEEKEGFGGVDNVYFTSFVIQ